LAATFFLITGIISPFAQEDKTKAKVSPINAKIESWYKIVDGEKEVGFFHEILTPKNPEGAPNVAGNFGSGNSGLGYEYFAQAQLKVMEEEASFQENATLDKDFVPASLTRKDKIGNKIITVTLYQTKDVKTCEVQLADGTTKKLEIDKKEVFYITPTTALFALAQKHLLEKDKIFEIKELSFTCDPTPLRPSSVGDPPRLCSTKIQVIAVNEKKSYLDKKEANVTAVKEIEGPIFYLDSYGRTLEVIDTPNLTSKIGGSKKGMIIVPLAPKLSDLSQLDAQSEYGEEGDPFQPKLTPKNKQNLSKPATPIEKSSQELVGDVKKAIQFMTKELSQMKILKEEGKQDELVAVYEKLVGLYAAAIATTSNSVERDELNNLRLSIEEIYPGVNNAFLEAQEIYKNQETKFLENKLDELASGNLRLKKISTKPCLVGSEVAKKINDLCSKSEELLNRCKTKSELLKKNLKVSGIFYYVEEKPVNLSSALALLGNTLEFKATCCISIPKPSAIVNGKTVFEGSVIEGCLVKKINRNDVIFSYAGEEVAIRIKF